MTISWTELEPILCQVGILAILAVSLNVVCGLTGLLQLGHAGFFAIGAYVAGLYSIYFTVPELGWLNFVIGASAGMTAAMVFALVVGFPCLGLRGDYLAIVTLGFGEIVRLLLTNIEFPGGKMFPGETIGGPTGIAFTESPGSVWPASPGYSAEYGKLWMIWLLVLVTYVVLLNIKRSSIGRALMCIREDEIVARTMGVQVPRYKITAFLISAAFAGLAGALFFHQQLRIAPGNFSLLKSIEVLLIVVLGGMGSLLGSICAAFVLGLLPFILRHIDLSAVAWLPSVMQKPLSEYNMLLYALLLIVLIRLMPDGIMGMGELPAWFRGRRDRKEEEPGDG
ncbi:MAG: branched-chain amino acid ABC transporter permease [Verrucomicrobia bacterium]|nr:branched-chain amino acid ABC transporter permease [Verrucomicrobiota bacterium]